jgi:hypothetical protein
MNLQTEIIRKIEADIAPVIKGTGRGIFEVNGRRINIRTATDKGVDRYWFDVTPTLYSERKVEFLLFTCGYLSNTYIFPVEVFAKMIEGASLGGQKQVPNFNLRTDSHQFEPCGLRGKKFDISLFFNNFTPLGTKLPLLQRKVSDDLDSISAEEWVEGGLQTRFVNYYERDPRLRAEAIRSCFRSEDDVLK